VGLVICSKITTSRAYNIVINTIQLPMIFSSSAFYPKIALPYPLLLLASVNPLSYAADSLRDIFVLGRIFPSFINIIPLSFFSFVSIFTAIWFYSKVLSRI
ncbi:MAG: ABC transporter permease, partial [archaeon]|nr:ABC transporter permease [archaeon]